MKRSKELKTMARMQLAGKYSTYIGAYALFFMISGTVASLLGFFLMSGSLSSSDGLPFTSIPTDSVFCDRIDCFPYLIDILPGIQQNVSGWKPWLSGTV